MLGDAAIAIATLWLAFMLRFDGSAPPDFVQTLRTYSPLAVATIFIGGLTAGHYGNLSRYAGLREILRLGGLVAGATAVLLTATIIEYVMTGVRPVPLSVPLIWSPFLFIGLSVPRLARRVRAQVLSTRKRGFGLERILIAGAGDAGERVARDMLHDARPKVVPVGFLDDDPSKHGRQIHGLPVFGPISELATVAQASRVDQLLIAIPSAPSSVVRDIFRTATKAGIKAQILPSLGELMGAKPTPADVRDVDISDLIARNQVKPDMRRVGSITKGRTVLVTGAAGSIGNELARQSIYFSPSKLLLLDTNETDLYALVKRLSATAEAHDVQLEMLIADIRDKARIDTLFAEYRPNLVFHAAAYKHVPVMELHPAEAIKTNVRGTRNLAEAACTHRAERFVLVSTDKAVNPSSVMGATKRLAEMVISLNASGRSTVFCSVRFGNVLGSRGSVVPIFAEQVRAGGPITVTHPDVTRYFMTIEEAVALICQAAALGKGGETFVLEMGQPVKIMDLAERMRALLVPDHPEDIDIVVTGLRVGEKLHEDLWHAEESLVPVHPGILRTKHSARPDGYEHLKESILNIENLAFDNLRPESLKRALFEIVDRLPEPLITIGNESP